MPRRAKAQQPAAPPGQDYGDRQEQVQAQQAIPLPQTQGQAGAAPGAAMQPTGGAQGAAPASEGDQLAQMLAAASAMPVESAPWAGTDALGEMVTAGLPTGPGAGPEALGQPSRTGLADVLLEIARTTGDPRFADLAQLAAAGDL